MRAGELGSLPIIVGLVVIGLVFGTLDDTFFTERNFTNLLLQMAPIATIAIGVVFVLLIGEIDLSVAFVSAVGGVTMTLLLRPDESGLALVGRRRRRADRDHLDRPAAGAGDHQGGGAVVRRHAGGSAHLVGVVLILTTEYSTSGTIRIQDDTVIGIANDFLSDAGGWVVGAVGVAGVRAVAGPDGALAPGPRASTPSQAS